MVNQTVLLKNALIDLESLEEYYHWQLSVTGKYFKKNIGKFKFSIVLEKYFISMIDDEIDIELSDEEQNIINTIIDTCEVEKGEDRIRIKYTLKNTENLEGYILSPEEGRNEFRKLIDRPKLLLESTLINLLIKYEEYISGIFRFLIEKYPDAYLSDKKITYAEFLNLKEGLHDVKKRFIDKEIDELMRQPISEWYKKIKEKHKIEYAFADSDFKEFTKIYYTRNIIVHNQGIVNESYINGTGDSNYSVGDRIELDKEYIDKAIDLTRIILIGTFWGIKKLASDGDEINTLLFNKGYDFLAEGKWSLSKFINSTLLKDSNQDEASLLCEKVNYWIAEKNINGLNSIRAEVEALDTSTMNRQFVIAKLALLEDFDAVSKELEVAIDNDIPAKYITIWPLFNEYRESDNYKTFLDNHKEQFNIFGYESPGDNADYLEEASKDIEKEKNNLIAQLEISNSFTTTHSIIKDLNDFGEWSNDDVERLCKIAHENTQVNWILKDEDIKSFYIQIIKSIQEGEKGVYTKKLIAYYNPII